MKIQPARPKSLSYYVKWNRKIRKLKHKIFKRDGYLCFYCKIDMLPIYQKWLNKKFERGPYPITVDHVIPKTLFKRDDDGLKKSAWTESNLVTCCPECNSRKGNKIIL